VVHVDLVFAGSDPDHASLKAAREASKLLTDFRLEGFVGCGVLGGQCASPAQLSEGLAEAADATLGRFFRPGMLVSGVSMGTKFGETANPLEAFPARIQTLVREGDRASLEPLLDHLRRCLLEVQGHSSTVRHTLAGMLGPEGATLLETCPDGPRLILALEERIVRDLDLIADRGASLADRALAKLRDEIAQRLGEADLAIDEISRDLQVSPSYLAKLLRRRWDTNFSRFLREVRISKAKELLAATNLTTTLIAEQTGFHDYRYFSNQFKRSVGLTPSGYRAQTRTALGLS
jgi:AraC-like DNA-binding protein